jgi:hypothetical protein
VIALAFNSRPADTADLEALHKDDLGEAYRLGSSGRYILPHLPVSEEDDALLLFMEAIEAVHPRVIEDLKAEVLPANAAFSSALDQRCAQGRAMELDELPEEARYRKALAAWQRRYHLDRWVDLPADDPRRQPDGFVPPHKTPAGRFQFLVEAVLALWRDAEAPPEEPVDGSSAEPPPARIRPIHHLAWESRKEARWANLLRTILDKEHWTRIQLFHGGPGVAEYRKAIAPPPLPRYNPVESPQTWGEYMTEAGQLLEAYRKKVEEAIARVGGGKAAEKLCLKHFRWLAQRQVLGRRPSDIGAVGGGSVSPLTVRNALKATAALIGLRLRAVRSGPKLYLS